MKPISTKEFNLYADKDISKNGADKPLPLLEHIEELRNKLIICTIVLSISTLLGFYFSRYFIKSLTDIAPENTMFLQIRPGEFFFTSLKVSLYSGLVIALPLILWQFVSFISPGLSDKEKKILFPVVLSSPVLLISGSIFAYFFIAPSMLNFLFSFGKDIISTSISIESFVSFALMIMITCGVTFLLPIVLFVLANFGVINSGFLLNQWRYAILFSVVFGAIITPTPDPFNMCIVSGILIALYFMSIGGLKIIRL